MNYLLFCLTFCITLGASAQSAVKSPAQLRAEASEYLRKGECLDAIISLSAALLVNPNDWKTHEEMGWYYGWDGCDPNYEKAIEKFKEALDLNPTADVLWNIGDCYRNLNDYSSAIEYYESYLNTVGFGSFENRIKRSEVLPNLGLCYFYNGSTERACEIWALRHTEKMWLDANVSKSLYDRCAD